MAGRDRGRARTPGRGPLLAYLYAKLIHGSAAGRCLRAPGRCQAGRGSRSPRHRSERAQTPRAFLF
ncbi:hypothetical protein DV515_00007541 [Chloebia gouldiae]|uniref:Uncharacterized protein n=1 Tax=Chloebia gouldiae TaxID=44316 RepID=A0A3L8SIZ9_CHLGU|nr:hypothetical protein DV515_00007541 [Chloebia gouldiae]